MKCGNGASCMTSPMHFKIECPFPMSLLELSATISPQSIHDITVDISNVIGKTADERFLRRKNQRIENH